jgi:uncharacterized protein DUF177 involved in 23S rRNA accumulation
MTTEPWSVTVRLDEVPETGRHIALETSEAVRAAVAKTAHVDAVDALSAAFEVTRRGRNGLRVVGAVRASVRQTCVVSLEPVVNMVEETIDVTFAPPRAAVPDPRIASDDEDEPVGGSISGDDPPEPLVNGTIDLGALATEFLILGVDPYPRKAGIAFTPPAAAADSAGHPFAALAALKKTSKVKD